jgi:hypothetical protein
VLSIPFNIIHNIINDLNEIAMRVKSNIQSIVENKKSGKSKTKHYLIIFTESEDLFILNADTGLIHLEKYIYI